MPTRYNSIGLSGRKDSETNIVDSAIKTVEFPLTVVASGSAQDTGIAAPLASIQVLGSYIRINTAEVTGTTKTVSIGITGSNASIQSGTDVSAAGTAGTSVGAALSSSASTNFTYTLGSADFVELDATCVVTYIGADV